MFKPKPSLFFFFLIDFLFGEKRAKSRRKSGKGSTHIDVFKFINLYPASVNSVMQGKNTSKYFQVKPFITEGSKLCRDAIIIQNKALKAKETQNHH